MSLCETCKRAHYACKTFAVCGGKLVKPREKCDRFRKKVDR